MALLDYVILVVALAGFIDSWYIYHKKFNKKKMTCVIGKKCDIVLWSKYNKIGPFANEILGMLFYAFVVIATVVIMFTASPVLFIWASLLLMLASFLSFFSHFILTLYYGLCAKGLV